MSAPTGEVLEGEVIREFTEHEARDHVERMRSSLAIAAEHVLEAWTRRIWTALGYKSWEAFLDAEFGEFELPRVEKYDLMVRLRNAGASKRAIAHTTGLSRNTVDRHLAQIEPPDEVVGNDGKTYPATQPERNATQQEGAGDDGSPCEGDDAGSVDGADSHDVGRTEPGSAPAPPDPGEADDREAPEGHSSPDTSPGSPIDVLDEIDPEGMAEAEDAAYRTALHRSIARVRADLFTFDAGRIAEVAGPDTWAAIDEVCAAFDRWRDALEAARPKPFTVIRGGAQ